MFVYYFTLSHNGTMLSIYWSMLQADSLECCGKWSLRLLTDLMNCDFRRLLALPDFLLMRPLKSMNLQVQTLTFFSRRNFLNSEPPLCCGTFVSVWGHGNSCQDRTMTCDSPSRTWTCMLLWFYAPRLRSNVQHIHLWHLSQRFLMCTQSDDSLLWCCMKAMHGRKSLQYSIFLSSQDCSPPP